MNAEQSEVNIYKFWGRIPQKLIGQKAPYKPPAGTSRSPTEGRLTASIYIYIFPQKPEALVEERPCPCCFDLTSDQMQRI